jgi:hypothetical protein
MERSLLHRRQTGPAPDLVDQVRQSECAVNGENRVLHQAAPGSRYSERAVPRAHEEFGHRLVSSAGMRGRDGEPPIPSGSIS